MVSNKNEESHHSDGMDPHTIEVLNKKLDMSLDELIAANKNNRGSTHSMRRRRGGARNDEHTNITSRSSAQSIPHSQQWRHRVRSFNPFIHRWPESSVKKRSRNGQPEQERPRKRFKPSLVTNKSQQSSSGTLRGKKLYVSNLDHNVSNKDIEILFSEDGKVGLKNATIHFDEKGRSLGTGEVVFAREEDAVAAMNKYDGKKLDGRPLDIHLLREEDKSHANRNIFENGGGRRRGQGRERGGGIRRERLLISTIDLYNSSSTLY
ncbi:THO complex subunit 4A-like [Cryptomeria japonica]|uniref:THO complex subunit 4A-like n=1 Tax=Cryptomeria japonica TaxID=3369 RepID=UPI0027D9F0C7|nr:THO complex subunit 4A-like [Cryptomeria japonica]